ncbi:MAG: phosphoribosylaminoimidazolesuccinocarboxamide synthase [Firmicutes bacterium]|nr:phosphoribosylaminoimidazolesuccinocarboxamide synthase [Bacillota bacterium]MCL2256572.1 phosphoribosylaminoimidazolesuccinocarboxamide synthase [Bacillota bacterium]
MKLIYKGKSKDVFDNGDGNYLFQFKDDVTGADGVIDPGANQVIGQVEGLGRENLRLTEYFYKLLNSKGIPTHFVSADVEKRQMVVRPASLFGKGVEVIVRLKATGSFIRRFGDYIKDGDKLDYLVETTLKDDHKGDPFITREIHEVLGVLKSEEYDTLERLAKQITKVVEEELAKKELELWDIKFEFARVEGKIMLVDEISGGCMRAFRNGKPVPALDIANILLGK